MKHRLGLLITAVLTFSILLTACAPVAPAPAQPAEQAQPAAPAQPAAEPAPGGIKRGGTLKWAVGMAPENFDIAWSENNADIWVAVNVFEALVRINADGTEIEPGLADSWEISDDGLTYTFHMRDGIKFSDGNPVTIEDVVFSLNRAKDTGVWNWSLANVDSIEAIDDTHVKIVLKEESAEFLAGLALFSNAVLPQAAFEAAGMDGDTALFFQHPIGTGPFMVTDWVVGDHVTLEKNPYYWEMGEDGKPLPYLDGVEVTQVAEDMTRVLQVQSGDIHGTAGIPFSQVTPLENDPTATVMLWPSTQSYYVFMNHMHPPMDDLNVRLAMNYAADKQALQDAVLSGHGELATSFFPKSSPCWNPNLEGFPYDLDKAKQLMADSKYPDGYQGLKIGVPSGRVIGRDQATILKEMWSKIGIEAEVNEVEGGLLSSSFHAGDFDTISGYQWTNDVIDPAQQVGWFVVDPAIHSGWHNDRAVELAKQAAVELDPDKRCEMYYEIQKIFNDEAVVILMYHTPFTTFINKKVEGFYQLPLGWYVWKSTWINE